MKKLLSVILTVTMLLIAVCVPAFANSACTVTYYNGKDAVGTAATVTTGSSYAIDRVVENTETQYFAGWYTDAEFTKKAGTKLTVNEDVTLYAKMVDYATSISVSGADFTKYNYRETVPSWYPSHEVYYANYYAVYGDTYYNLLKLNTGTFAGAKTIDNEIVLRYGHNGNWNISSSYMIMDANGEAFVPKPETTYKVSVTYCSNTTSSNMKIGTAWAISDTTLKASGDYAFGGKDLTSSSYTIGGGISGDPAVSSNAVEQVVTTEPTTAVLTITTPTLAEYNGKLQTLGVYGFNVKGAIDTNGFYIKAVSVEEILPEACTVTYMNGDIKVGETTNIKEGTAYTIDRAVANTQTHYFAGWYTDAQLTAKAGTKITVSEDVTLYAKMVEYADSISVSGSQWIYNYRETVSAFYPHHEVYYANYYAAVGDTYYDLLRLNTGTFAGYATVNDSKVLRYGHNNSYNISSSYMIMDANGEAFVPQPSTEYKISVTYYSNTTSSNMKIGTAWTLSDTTLKASGNYAFSGKDLNSSSYTIGGGISGDPAVSSDAVEQVVTTEPTTAEFTIFTPSLEGYEGKLQTLGLYGFNVKESIANNGFYITKVVVEKGETIIDTTDEIIYMNGIQQVGEAVQVEKGNVYTIDRVVPNTDTHYFAGWFTDSARTVRADTRFTVTKDVTLYAKMVKYSSRMSVATNDWKYNYRETVSSYYPYHEAYYANYYGAYAGSFYDLLKVNTGTYAGFATIDNKKVLRFGHSGGFNIPSTYAIMDGEGKIFVPKPNTEYKVSVTYYSDTTASNMKIGTAWTISDTTLKASCDYAFNGKDLNSSSYTIGGGIKGDPAVTSEAVAQIVTTEPTTAEFIITTPSLEDYEGKLQALVLYGFNVKSAINSNSFYISEIKVEDTSVEVEETEPIRILAIGNSYSNNATQFIDRIAEDMGLNVEAYSLYYPGCTISAHVNYYNNESEVYGLTTDGTNISYSINTMQKAFALYDYDYVTIQQSPDGCDDFESYWTENKPWLTQLVDIIKENEPQAEIMIHQTWSFAENCATGEESYWSVLNYENSKEMFGNVEEAYIKASEKMDGAKIIPVGKAIQLAKDEFGYGDFYNTKENGSLTDIEHLAGGALYTDYICHLNVRGRYIASCVWIEKILGVDCRTTEYCPEILSEEECAILREIAHEAVTGEQETVVDNWRVVDNGEGVKITHFAGTVAENGVVEVPKTIGGKAVNAIDHTIFKYVDGLSKIVLPKSAENVWDVDEDSFPVEVVYGETQEYSQGDINGDGTVDAADLALLKKVIAKLTPIDDDSVVNPDVDGEGSTPDAADLALLKKIIAKLV